MGTNLVSMSTGTVTFAGQESGYGTIVKIRYWDGTVSFYGHMSNLSVTGGETSCPARSSDSPATPATRPDPTCTSRSTPTAAQPVNPLPWLADRRIAF